MCTSVIKSNLQLALVILEHLLCYFEADVAALHQFFYVHLANASLLCNGLVHERLCVARIITFVVTVQAVTNHVDHYVFVELLTVFECKTCNTSTCLWVISVHVEDRRLHSFCNICCILRRTCKLRCGGETNLVVHHKVNGAAHAIAIDVAHCETFGHNALTGKSCVTMHQQRQHAVRKWRFNLVLLCAHHAQHNAVHGFQVAGVRCKFHFNVGTIT